MHKQQLFRPLDQTDAVEEQHSDSRRPLRCEKEHGWELSFVNQASHPVDKGQPITTCRESIPSVRLERALLFSSTKRIKLEQKGGRPYDVVSAYPEFRHGAAQL
jgi:hypothetical protein